MAIIIAPLSAQKQGGVIIKSNRKFVKIYLYSKYQ